MDSARMGIDRKTHRLREENMARKRNQEYHKQLFWNDMTNYYKTWDIQASKHNVWASQTTTPSLKANNKKHQEELEQRRCKLKALLEKEQKEYEDELRNRASQKSPYRTMSTEELKAINFELKRKEEEARKREAELKKYQQWKMSNPVLKELERKQYQAGIQKTWIEQVKEKQLQKEKEKEEMLKLEEERKRQLMVEEAKEKELICQKKEEIKRLNEYLLQQINVLKTKERLAQEIKLQEEQEMQLKRRLELIAVKRNQIEKERNARELSSVLRHQYQLKLKRRSKRIQEELNEDRQTVEELVRCLEMEDFEDSKIRQNARKEIDKVNLLLHEFVKLERKREKEMEFIFHEEARKMWNQQEARWSSEEEIRNNLMREVLVTIQKQVKEKLQASAEEHKKLIEERERILNDLEETNKRLKAMDLELKEKQQKWLHELNDQVFEKNKQKDAEELEKIVELKRNQEELIKEEEKLLQELRKMSASPRQMPKSRSFW